MNVECGMWIDCANERARAKLKLVLISVKFAFSVHFPKFKGRP